MLKPVGFIAFLLLSSAVHADQTVIADSLLPADFAPASATPPSGDGFWAFGTSNGLAALVRYGADSSVNFVRFPGAAYPSSFKVAAMPDGGVVSTDIEDFDVLGDQKCTLRRFDSAGNLLWANHLAQPTGVILVGAVCSNVYIDGSGGIWLFPAGANQGYIVSVNPDGTAGPQISTSDTMASQIVAAAGPAVYLAGATGDPYSDPPTTLATIWKITAQGIEWSAPAPAADTGSVLDDIVTGADGSLWSFGHKDGQLYGVHADANGSVLWSGAFETAVAPTQVSIVARSDGGVSTVHWDETAFEAHAADSAPELSRFSAAGARLWHVSTAFALPINANTAHLTMAAAGDGDSIVALSYNGGGQPDTNWYVQQLRVDDGGVPLYMTAAQARQRLSGVEARVLGDESSLTIDGTFRRLARNGAVLPAPPTAAITTSTSLDDKEVIAPDGATYLLAINADSKTFGVSAYSGAGALRWQMPSASGWNNGGLKATQLLLRSSDVCVAGFLDGSEVIQCFALADGTPAPLLVLASSIDAQNARSQAIVTAADEIVLLYAAADGSTHHALIDAQRNVMHDVAPLVSGETWRVAAQNANGETVVGTVPAGLVKIAADGSRGYAVATDVSFNNVALASDGTSILVSYSVAPVLERLDTNGSRLWQTTMPAGPYNTVRSLRFAGNDLYFVLITNFAYYGFDGAVFDGLVAKLALADGATQWSAPLPYVFGHTPRLALDLPGENLISFSSWGDRTNVRKFATADGAPAGAKFEPCDVDFCELYQATVATDGTLRMVHDTTDLYTGSAWEQTIMQDEFDKVFADGFGP